MKVHSVSHMLHTWPRSGDGHDRSHKEAAQEGLASARTLKRALVNMKRDSGGGGC